MSDPAPPPVTTIPNEAVEDAAYLLCLLTLDNRRLDAEEIDPDAHDWAAARNRYRYMAECILAVGLRHLLPVPSPGPVPVVTEAMAKAIYVNDRGSNNYYHQDVASDLWDEQHSNLSDGFVNARGQAAAALLAALPHLHVQTVSGPVTVTEAEATLAKVVERLKAFANMRSDRDVDFIRHMNDILGQPLGMIYGSPAPPVPAASELDAFSTWFDQIAEQNIATLDNEGRATEGWDMAEVVATFRANRAEIQ